MEPGSLRQEATTPTWVKLCVLVVMLCVLAGLACMLIAGRDDPGLARIGWGVLVAGVLLATVVAVLEFRRAPHLYASPAKGLFEHLARPSSAGTDVGWVEVDPAFLRQTRRWLWTLYLLPLAMLIPWSQARFGFTAAEQDAGRQVVTRLVEIVSVVAFLVTAVVVVFVRRQVDRKLRSRIGTDGAQLLYDPGTGQIERHDWTTVLTNKSDLLIGHRLIRLHPSELSRTPLFPPDALRRLILSRLPPTSFVTPPRLLWTALVRGNIEFRLFAAGLALFAAFQLVSWIWPEWVHAMRDAALTWLAAQID